ncbi:hypothetical protein MUO14_22030 [Halobacillus shinanisalinarum]|uniref:YtxH domain-containing protein n=1 Tax=Halobacillus shinanisalinarum TaxID=2932258 RepID=A0ABY4GYT6_9BACI|nr:hypothetical protein [Halobacillus shinanisalinarum]UOQ93044.1 hypothetical protein MUO14_22030 [Halobacillus shinanisalinarum]
MIFLRKRWIFTAVGAAAGGTLAYFMKDEDNRKRVTDKAKSLQANLTQDDEQGDMPIEEAGQQEVSNPENSKMVSEGSQFGVQYYNELTEKEREILEKSNS